MSIYRTPITIVRKRKRELALINTYVIEITDHNDCTSSEYNYSELNDGMQKRVRKLIKENRSEIQTRGLMGIYTVKITKKMK